MFALACALAWASPFDDADAARLTDDVRVLAGATELDGVPLASRHVSHPDHARAGAWLERRLAEASGRPVVREPVPGWPGAFNLVAELPGTSPHLDPVLVGAHWDSTASAEAGFEPATDPAPGADDDASGVAAVLEIARLLSGTRVQRTVRFALFDAEEVGLVGSETHAQALVDAGQGLRLALSLDPIGYNPGATGFVWVTYDARWPADAEALQEVGDERSDLTVTALDAALIGGDERSDHAPFWARDLPAVHVASYPQPDAYHTSADTIDVVDTAFLRDVTGVVAEHVWALADPVPPAEPTGCATARRPTWLGLFRRRT